MQVGSKVYNLFPDGTLPMDVPLEIEAIETTNVINSVIDEVNGKKEVTSKMMPATWFIIKGFPGKHRKYQFETESGWKQLKEADEVRKQSAEVREEFYNQTGES